MKFYSIKVAASIAAGLLFAAPFAASAVTLEDLQNQVASLLKQISALQNQTPSSGSASESVTVSASAQLAPGYRFCGLLNRSLSLGSRGDDVSGLQEFLQSQGLLSVNPTGYFGPLTAQAVAKWQTSEGVTAAGAFGPMSRERLKIKCGGSTANNFQVSPQNGEAPLSVDFTTSGSIVDDGFYSVDFGDGQQSAMTKGSCVGIAAIQGGQGGIRCSFATSHAYTANGTYTAQLIYGGCGNYSMCDAALKPRTTASVTVTVGGSSKGSVSANPHNGAAPLSVKFTYLPTAENGTYHIDYGDGAADIMSTQQIYCIKAPCISPAVSNHTYTSAGTYTIVVSPYIACLYSNPRCMIAVMMLAKTTVTVTGNGSGAPVISGLSGPTTLAINTNGTWTIKASDPEGGSLNYQITWGDENVYAPMMQASGAARDFVQSSTFTHAYANAGTYTVAVVVTDDSGLSAKTSTTVRVGNDGVACTMEYAPVCGVPQVCAVMEAIGNTCSGQTYSNRCMMNAAGATFLYNGACRSQTACTTSDGVSVDNGNTVPVCRGVAPPPNDQSHFQCTSGSWTYYGFDGTISNQNASAPPMHCLAV